MLDVSRMRATDREMGLMLLIMRWHGKPHFGRKETLNSEAYTKSRGIVQEQFLDSSRGVEPARCGEKHDNL
jgi:hypothetical protein